MVFIGFALSVILVMIIMPFYIKALKNRNINQVTSEYALDEYKNKGKTPIMGGLLFVIVPVIVFAIINFKGFNDRRLLFVILSYLLYCSVGFIDDMLVIIRNNNNGLTPLTRIIMETVYSVILYVAFKDVILCQVTIPFINVGLSINPIVFVVLMTLIYEAEANAVNFTDGMDGLCAGVSFIGLIPFAIFSLMYQENNIAILIFSILGGLLAYLYFNHYPAKIFMGDSGSLALGALFASMGIIYDKCIALFFIGGVFVCEMFCVVLQQLSVRLFHKRVFSYTPIHYAFSIKGYKETKIVTWFYIAELLFAIIGFIIGINTL